MSSPVNTVTIVSDESIEIEAAVVDGRILIAVDALPDALGWTLKPEGLCRDDTCVPVRERDALFAGERLDLAAVADALGRPTVVDADAAIVAVALDREQRRAALESLTAPDVILRDLDGDIHALSDWRGKKRLLHAFSSWCGCRYDLPGWQALQDELGDENFTVIAVAIDESPDDVRPWTDDVTTMPVLIDPQHVLSEVYAISNVPAVVWIDEDDNIVRPNSVAFSNDMFKEFTGVESGPHLDAVRAWVRDGTSTISETDARAAVPDLSDDEVLARLHFRVGVEARRRGDDATARRHLERAGELAPMDFTVRRAAMPLLGDDPFGPEFMDLFAEWQAAGSPFHGLAPMTGDA
jgi:peroxiredoxin